MEALPPTAGARTAHFLRAFRMAKALLTAQEALPASQEARGTQILFVSHSKLVKFLT